MPLILNPQIDKPDDFYEAWLLAHEGLSTQKSHDLNAAIVLLLANHIGDFAVLQAALTAARSAIDGVSHAATN
jgi:Protein of unknown function (DUF2783)